MPSKTTGGDDHKVIATKKPVYHCLRHGYETDASASRESQLHGKAMHLGKAHGGRGTAKHSKRASSATKNNEKGTRNGASLAHRTTTSGAHTRISGSRSHSISFQKVQTLKKTWLHDAAVAEPNVADAIVRCMHDLNQALGS